ncbi:hypothetical protein RRG08_003105 [Elysia crispata]|uniref:Uncharacterized protein n=1 Tax=Elysia crispata TaxID=231223 RepID=A0AAE1EAQ8_9GAST|nr:hypothetical protein RRG08_003105 [Elysia crispata]
MKWATPPLGQRTYVASRNGQLASSTCWNILGSLLVWQNLLKLKFATAIRLSDMVLTSQAPRIPLPCFDSPGLEEAGVGQPGMFTFPAPINKVAKSAPAPPYPDNNNTPFPPKIPRPASSVSQALSLPPSAPPSGQRINKPRWEISITRP